MEINKEQPSENKQTNTVYSELSVARESTTVSCDSREHSGQTEEWERGKASVSPGWRLRVSIYVIGEGACVSLSWK